MPRPHLRVVPEIPAPCRAAKAIAGALIVTALLGLVVTTAKTKHDGLPMAALWLERTSPSVAAPTARLSGTDYFPAGYTLNANDATPHVQAF